MAPHPRRVSVPAAAAPPCTGRRPTPTEAGPDIARGGIQRCRHQRPRDADQAAHAGERPLQLALMIVVHLVRHQRLQRGQRHAARSEERQQGERRPAARGDRQQRGPTASAASRSAAPCARQTARPAGRWQRPATARGRYRSRPATGPPPSCSSRNDPDRIKSTAWPAPAKPAP